MRFERFRILLAVVLVMPTSAVGGEIVDRVVAIVDREVVTLGEAEEAMSLERVQGREEPTFEEVIERLIESRLIEREVKRYAGESIAGEDVQKAIESLRASFASEAEYRQAVAAHGLTEEALEEMIRRQLEIHHYLERRFRSLVQVTDEEIAQYYRDELIPAMVATGEPVPDRESVEEPIRLILAERNFNRRVDEWIEGLKARTYIRRYVW